jgi:hypothetical protein
LRDARHKNKKHIVYRQHKKSRSSLTILPPPFIDLKNSLTTLIKILGSVDVSFAAAFGPVLGLNKEKIATWYEYHERFLTPCSPKNELNPKG